MRSQKTSPLVSVHLSESGHLFSCTLQLKYTKVLSSHCSAVWDGLSKQLSDKLLYKNYKIALSELSLNQAMIRVPDIFFIPLIWTTF